MPLEAARFLQLLNDFKLGQLFNELGWDRAPAQTHAVPVGDETFALTPIAQKRGVTIFQCAPNAVGAIPSRPTLLKIEKEARKLAHEHLLIFSDQARSTQTWLWVARAPGQPDATRTHTWHQGTSGESLRQKLEHIAFTLSEEESITLTLASQRLRDAFDRDRVTRRFYERFAEEHGAFTDFITGITARASQQWYASLMLNRLMFVYFIQKKGFLDGNIDYLGERLRQVQAQAGRGKFHSFYRQFLKRLFHEGLGLSKPRGAALDALLGDIPYLNGGLFDVHELEEAHPDIDIPDEAFERLFRFFDAYDWHLDDRPLASGTEINPDVLGYIFEKYINQKQMGAYYTKEDITGYIAKNTVIPFLLERAKERCKVAFEGSASVWALLAADPDRYLYPAMRRGVVSTAGQIVPESALPDFVQTGMHDAQARMFDRRYNLGAAQFVTPDGDNGTLPTETWREYVERRRRCLDIRQKMQAGELRTVDDLITYNLDIRQFMQDVIEQHAGAELLRAIWQAMVGRVPEKSTEHFRHGLSILDPTCGSGAFLFAALNVLEPLYEACIERMEDWVAEADLTLGRHSRESGNPESRSVETSTGFPLSRERQTNAGGVYPDFRAVLAEVRQHPSRRYFIYKSIVVHNLYGVDLMAEAVEICKLRLFLKLVSQVEDVRQLEPLPDIDFNIRTGNTLVGYATLEQLQASANLASDHKQLQEIEARAADLADAFDRFREQQTRHGGKVTAQDKRGLRDRLSKLSLQLDRFLAVEYGKDPDKARELSDWRASHQPFHWFAEFYSVMREGGFDVVIGNPPWKEYSAVREFYTVNGYATVGSGNLYALCTERSLAISRIGARFSFIVQLPLVSSSRMGTTRHALRSAASPIWVATFDDRPGKLFEGLQHCRSTIFLCRVGRSDAKEAFVTPYTRWPSEARPALLETIRYVDFKGSADLPEILPKHASAYSPSIFSKAAANRGTIAMSRSRQITEHFVFYQEATQYWAKATSDLPYYAKNGRRGAPAHGRYIYFASASSASAAAAVLNSSLFYAYFIAYGDCFHLSDTLASGFPIPATLLQDQTLRLLNDSLMRDLVENAERKTITSRRGGGTDRIEYDEYSGALCKNTIDKIDEYLGTIYGLTSEETDFVINYDIKFRMGNADDEE